MGVGAATNKGKSRFIVRLLCDLAIVNRVPCLIIINETKISEFQLQILCCITNNVISKRYNNHQINESKIAMGDLSEDEMQMVKEAAIYIEENSKLIVYETYIYDPATLKMIIRKHQLRDNIQYFFIDIYKPFRTIGGQNMAEWQMFSEGINQIKQMSVELNIFVMFTFQLKTTNENVTNLDVDATANGTHIAHYVDTLIMLRDIGWQERDKLRYILNDAKNPWNGQEIELDPKKTYYDFKIVKNRAGLNGVNIVYEVQKGELIFNELGLMRYVKKQ
jgi:replicative DNA helicase